MSGIHPTYVPDEHTDHDVVSTAVWALGYCRNCDENFDLVNFNKPSARPMHSRRW